MLISAPGLGGRFSAPAISAVMPTQLSITMGTRLFPGGKAPGCGVNHPPSSSAVIEWSCTFMACSGVDFTFTFYLTVRLADQAVDCHGLGL
jgi:hypothetical protein